MLDDGSRNFVLGYALPSGFFTGKLGVFFGGDFRADYRIIDTDYTSYSIVYSCQQVGPFSLDTSWLLVRDQIEEGTSAFTSMISLIDPIYEEKLPNYDRDTLMSTTK